MSEETKISVRFEGRAFLKVKEKYYQIVEVKTSGKIGEIQEQAILCYDRNRKLSIFKMKGKDLLEPYIESVKAERETGCPQILLIDIDTGEWKAYPITNELKKRFPFLRDYKGYIV